MEPLDKLLEEWKEARSITDKMDDLLAGLRKYGFSFITALIGANSILGQATTQATVIISAEGRLGVLLATLVLVIGLYSIDRYYSMIQAAAGATARKIEQIWNKESGVLGPTEMIASAYRSKRGWLFVDLLYALFGIADFVLGVILLYQDARLLYYFVFAGISVLALGVGMSWVSSTYHQKFIAE